MYRCKCSDSPNCNSGRHNDSRCCSDCDDWVTCEDRCESIDDADTCNHVIKDSDIK